MTYPQPSAVLELLKPVTWFAPIWAFGCGALSASLLTDQPVPWLAVLLGATLAGPLVCGTSQAVNDWYDRDVDAINQPERPIPSGRMPGRWGLYIGIFWSALSLAIAAVLGPVVFAAVAFGLVLAWIYSAPPLRLKLNGWWGNGAVALCYEGLPWLTGAAVMASVLPSWQIIVVALLYSFGAHGIMTLNDFKSIGGDRQLGIRTLPVQLGVDAAVKLACVTMLAPQLVVILLLVVWGQGWHALGIWVLTAAQVALMRPLLRNPRESAAWYNASGTTLYVLGMLIAAYALRTITVL